ncbi:MAG: glycoside hydrolase family 3 N-terminal domain-containing protein, partial [Paracoccaceae bacterium]
MSKAPLAAIFGCEGLRLTPDEAAFFRDSDPWGFILFARNVDDPDMIRRLTGDLRAAVGRDAPIMIDQEGGRVQRLGPPHWRQWLPPLDHIRATRPEAQARAMWLRHRVIADELLALGIDTNCAPTCDIAFDITHPFLRNRCFGTSTGEASQNARAAAEGLMAGGVLPMIKHIPGHGRALVDSHAQLPVADAPLQSLIETDFAPFRALADMPMAMTAHILLPAIDADLPATLSPKVIAAIRDIIGFQGLLITDDVSMEALAGPVAERAARSLAAGCDVALHCNGDMAEMQAIAAAVPTLTPKAHDRASAALSRRMAPDPI